MAQNKRTRPGNPPPPDRDCGPTGGSGTTGTGTTATGTTGTSGTTGTGTTGTASTPTASQLVQNSWGTSFDAQTAQQFTGLSQIRQARVNQLQRQVTSLTQAYGASDPRTVAAQASLTTQQTFASKLGVVSATTSTTAPAAPVNGWVIYGRVRNADLTPAPQLTIFLASENRAWLQKYAFAFTDQTGYFTLTYAPPASDAEPKKNRKESVYQPQECQNAYLEVSEASCKLMYMDSTPMSISAGAAIYRDIVLSALEPLGTPPCEPGAPGSTPPAQTTGNK